MTKKQILLFLLLTTDPIFCSESKAEKKSTVKTAAIITAYTAIPSSMYALSGASDAFNAYHTAIRSFDQNNPADSITTIIRPKTTYSSQGYYNMYTKSGQIRDFRTSNPIKFAAAYQAATSNISEREAILQGAKMGIRSGLPSATAIGIILYGLTQAYYADKNSGNPTL